MFLHIVHHRGRGQCTVRQDGPIVPLEQRSCAVCRGEEVGSHVGTRGNVGARFAFIASMSQLDVNPAAEASLFQSAVPVVRGEHLEGELARLIEQQAAKIPSHWFLFSALGAMALSLALELGGRSNASRFVGMWPTPLLTLGIYNKFVKTLGTR